MTSTAARRELIERLVRVVATSADAPEAYRDAARQTGALPVHCDMGGCLAMTPDGDIIEFDPETQSIRPVRDAAWTRRALVKAARRYDELADLLPQKPRDARVCAACGGQGVLVAGFDCAECGGLGWKD